MCLPGVARGTSGAVAGNTARTLPVLACLSSQQVDNYRYMIFLAYRVNYNGYIKHYQLTPILWRQPNLVKALGKGLSFQAFRLKGLSLPDPCLSFTIIYHSRNQNLVPPKLENAELVKYPNKKIKNKKGLK